MEEFKSPHNTLRQKKIPLEIPDWAKIKEEPKKDNNLEEIEILEKEIGRIGKILDPDPDPEEMNVKKLMTLPEGMTEKDFEDLEIKYNNLILELREKRGNGYV